MKLYTCTDHDGHFPVGVASIVLAENEGEAICKLDEQLALCGLDVYVRRPYTLQEIPTDKPIAIILDDGNY